MRFSAILLGLVALSSCDMEPPPSALERTASYPVECMADLMAAAGLACSFTHASVQPEVPLLFAFTVGNEFAPRRYTVKETDFDTRFVFKDGEASIVGNAGVEPVVIFRARSLFSPDSGETYQFLERTGMGVIQVTSVDAGLNAVHSRHSIVGGELHPSQYYGRCKCLY